MNKIKKIMLVGLLALPTAQGTQALSWKETKTFAQKHKNEFVFGAAVITYFSLASGITYAVGFHIGKKATNNYFKKCLELALKHCKKYEPPFPGGDGFKFKESISHTLTNILTELSRK
jgi:hypothetical protein